MSIRWKFVLNISTDWNVLYFTAHKFFSRHHSLFKNDPDAQVILEDLQQMFNREDIENSKAVCEFRWVLDHNELHNLHILFYYLFRISVYTDWKQTSGLCAFLIEKLTTVVKANVVFFQGSHLHDCTLWWSFAVFVPISQGTILWMFEHSLLSVNQVLKRLIPD